MECTRCRLHKYATTVGVESRGSSTPWFLFIGEAPDSSEDLDGIAFTGKAGKLLDELISLAGLNTKFVRMSNCVKCIPWQNPDTARSFRKVRTPSQVEVDACSIYLQTEILDCNPVILVALGNSALHSLVPDAPSIGKARGRRFLYQLPTADIPKMRRVLEAKGVSHEGLGYTSLLEECTNLGVTFDIKTFTVIPTWHPAGVFYDGGAKRKSEILNDLSYLASMATEGDDTLVIPGHKILRDLDSIKEHYDGIKFDFVSGVIDRMVIDIESDRVSPFEEGATLLGFSVCTKPGEAAFIPCNHPQSPFYNDLLAQSAISSMTQELLDLIPLVNHYVQFDINWLHAFGMVTKKVANCTYYSSWTLFNDTIEHDLETLATKFTDIKNHKEEMTRELAQLIGLVFDGEGNERKPNMGDVDLDIVGKYCNLDVESTLHLDVVLTESMREAGLLEAHNTFTVSCILPAAAMARNGIVYDVALSKEIEEEYSKRILSYYQTVYSILAEATERLIQRKEEEYREKLKQVREGGKKPAKVKVPTIKYTLEDGTEVETAKLSSPLIKKIILFDMFNFPPLREAGNKKEERQYNRFGKRIKQEITNPGTDREVLDKYLKDCLDNKDREGVGSFYADRIKFLEALKQFNADTTLYSRYITKLPSHVDRHGVVHGSFGIGTTDTSRWNASNPSLHTIPKEGKVKLAFKPIFNNGLILNYDYSQNELRVIAMLSNDLVMKNIFINGGDIHAEVMDMLGVKRRIAKNINFGVAYGESKYGLASKQDMSVEEAGQLIEDWYDRFYGVKEWVERQHELAATDDEVVTATGFRRLFIPGRFDPGEKNRRFVNTQIQGPASNIGGLAVSIIHNRLESSSCKSKLYAFIHDSIGTNVYPGELYRVAVLIKKTMEQVVPSLVPWIDLPLQADGEVGTSWGTCLGLHLLPDRCIRVSGKPDYFDQLADVLGRWDPKPVLESVELGVNKDDEEEITAVVRFLV